MPNNLELIEAWWKDELFHYSNNTYFPLSGLEEVRLQQPIPRLRRLVEQSRRAGAEVWRRREKKMKTLTAWLDEIEKLDRESTCGGCDPTITKLREELPRAVRIIKEQADCPTVNESPVDPLLSKAIDQMHFQINSAWERRIALHVRKRPWWCPRWLFSRLISLVLIQLEELP